MNKRDCVALALFLFLLVTSPQWRATGDIDLHSAVSGALVVGMAFMIVRDLFDRFPRF